MIEWKGSKEHILSSPQIVREFVSTQIIQT